MTDERDQPNYGAAYASVYDEIFPGSPELVEYLSSFSRLLEIGVGTGRIAIPVAKQGATVVGIDNSPEMLAACQRRAGSSKLDLRLLDAMDAGSLGEFEAVYAVCGTLSMILNVERQRKFVQVAASCVAPGGILVIENHDPAVVRAVHENGTIATWLTPMSTPGDGLLTQSSLLENSRWSVSNLLVKDGCARVLSEEALLLENSQLDQWAAAQGLSRLEAIVGDYPDGRVAPSMYLAIYSKAP